METTLQQMLANLGVGGVFAIAAWMIFREFLKRLDRALDQIDKGFALIDSNMKMLAGQIMVSQDTKHTEISNTLQRIEEHVSIRGK